MSLLILTCGDTKVAEKDILGLEKEVEAPLVVEEQYWKIKSCEKMLSWGDI